MEIESNRKQTEVWNFIRQNRNCFMDVNDELKCSICKNVLINAQQSECSCTFCRECIVEHLKNSNRCLGNNCDAYEINIDVNVNEDIRKNSKIKKLKCKCPTLNCNSEMSIQNLIEHVKLCSVKKCPFVSIGCNFEETSLMNIENHINTSLLNHNKLIVDIVNNLENKITNLQCNYRNIEDENKTLRDEVIELRNVKDEIEIMKQNHHEDIERVRGEYFEYINVIKHDFETKLNEFESKLELDKVEIEQLKQENCDNVEIIKKMENDLKNLKKESEDKSKKLENENKEIRNEVDKLKTEFITYVNKTEERFTKENEKIKLDHKEFEQKLNKYENEIKNKEQSIQEIEKTMKDKCDLKNEIRQSSKSIYVWRVDDIIQKREDAKRDICKQVLFSDPFFTKKSGYKLRLELDPNGYGAGLNTHLSLYLQIIMSGHDEILTWPFTDVVKFSLMNTRSKSPHTSYTFSFKEAPENERFVFDQPIKDIIIGDGLPQFISWTDLLDDTKNLIKDGSIYIKVDLEN